MPVALKSRVVSALLLLLMLARPMDMRPADAPLRKGLATSSQESEVIPRHEPRPLSRREIFQAIQNDLAQMGISGRGGLQPEDLKIQSSVPALKGDMGLQVKRIGFDPIRRETVFELWTSHEPQYLPFEVTTRRDPQSLGLTSNSAWKPGEAGGDPRAESPAIGQRGGRGSLQSPRAGQTGKACDLGHVGTKCANYDHSGSVAAGKQGPVHPRPRPGHRARDERGSCRRRAVADQFLRWRRR